MFLRSTMRNKDGKERRYWSVVESRRVSGNRTVQRQVLYLGEMNDGQQAAWSSAIEVFDEDDQTTKQVALFPENRQAPVLDCDVIKPNLEFVRTTLARMISNWGFVLSFVQLAPLKFHVCIYINEINGLLATLRILLTSDNCSRTFAPGGYVSNQILGIGACRSPDAPLTVRISLSEGLSDFGLGAEGTCDVGDI